MSGIAAARSQRILRLLFVVGLYSALVIFGLLHGDPGPESRITETGCRLILANSTEGRQALISSAWWAPLPYLLRLPFVALLPGDATGYASLLVSTGMTVASILLLIVILRQWGYGVIATFAAPLLLLVPGFLDAIAAGSSMPTTVFLSILIFTGLVEWIRTAQLRHLVTFAFGVAFLLLTRIELVPWVLLSIVFVLLDTLFRKAAPQQRQAIILLALLPLIYALGLWILMNWLVMGDSLYFLRPTVRAMAQQHPSIRLDPDRVTALTAIATGCGLLALAVGVLRWNRAAALGGLLALGLVASAWAIRWEPWPCDPATLIACALPVAALVALLALQILAPALGKARQSLLAAAILATIGMRIYDGTPLWPPAQAAPEELRVQAVANYVRSQAEHPKVFVCGFDGLELAHIMDDPVFIHTLDLNFFKAIEDYHGHALYILVRAPAGRGAMDSVHWRYPGISRYSPRLGTVLDRTWGDWRLFEVVEAPRIGPMDPR